MLLPVRFKSASVASSGWSTHTPWKLRPVGGPKMLTVMICLEPQSPVALSK